MAPSEADRDLIMKMATSSDKEFDYEFLFALFFPEYAEPA